MHHLFNNLTAAYTIHKNTHKRGRIQIDIAITDVLRELLMSREEYNEETEAVIVKHMPEKLEMVLSLHERFNR
jgi:hypothetical protein